MSKAPGTRGGAGWSRLIQRREHIMRSQYPIRVVAIVLVLVAGCIPGSRIGDRAQQVVIVRITDDESGAVENARITFAGDFRGSFTVSGVANDDDSYLERSQEGDATTDVEGRASLVLPTATVCHVTVSIIPGLGYTNCPDPLSDQVTGAVYLFRVETETASEFFPEYMQPGASFSGELFTLAVESVGEATPRP